MTEHDDLVKEMKQVERMTTTDRLKYARKKRLAQLKRNSAYDKQYDKKETKKHRIQNNTSYKCMADSTLDNRVNFIGEVILLEAAGRNDLAEVKDLLASGISPDAVNDDGLTALHQCCIDDQGAMMHLLVDFGANVNATDTELWTPLHAAATCGHTHLCKYLIDHGATILSVNADGNMPYDIAESETLDLLESEMSVRGVTQELIEDTRLQTEKVMLDDLKIQNFDDVKSYIGKSGESVLHIAAANGYIDVVNFLLSDALFEVNATDNDNWRPVHAAACWGQHVVLETLVRYGADLQVTTKANETPYDICEDVELKLRIQELKDEQQQTLKRQQQTTRMQSAVPGNLARKRSQNSRRSNSSHQRCVNLGQLYASLESVTSSASIRRTSMREKTQIHQREAADEATRMMEKTETEDIDEDDTLNSSIDFIDKSMDTPDIVNNNISENDVKEKLLEEPPSPSPPESPPHKEDPPPYEATHLHTLTTPTSTPTKTASPQAQPRSQSRGDTLPKRMAPTSPILTKNGSSTLPRTTSPSISVTSLSMINATTTNTYNLNGDGAKHSSGTGTTLAELKKARSAQRILQQQTLGPTFEQIDTKPVVIAMQEYPSKLHSSSDEIIGNPPTVQTKGDGCCVIS